MRRSQLVGAALAAVVVGLGAAPVVAATGSSDLHLELRAEKGISFTHNQGLARVPGGWILTGTDRPLLLTDNIVRTDEHLRVVRRNIPAIPTDLRAQDYDHIGDIDVVDGVIYAALEQNDYTRGVQVTAMYDAKTLAFIDSVELKQHENSFVAVEPKTMTAYSQNHFDGNTLLRYDIDEDWKPLPPLRMSRTLHHTQGADIANGYIWIATSDPKNDIYRVDLTTGHVALMGRFTHPGGEGEGIDVTRIASGPHRGDVHGLILDPSQRPIWFQDFNLVAGAYTPKPKPGKTGSGGSGSTGSGGSGNDPSSAGSSGSPAAVTGTDLPARWPALLAVVAALGLVRLTRGLRRARTPG